MTDQALIRLADDVARHLDGFTRDPAWPTWGVALRHADGRALHLAWVWGSHESRVEVGGGYPDGVGYKRFEITVAVSRGAQAIAREIERRLLPPYVAELQRVLAKLAVLRDEAAAVRCVAERIAGHLPDGRVSGGEGTKTTAQVYWAGGGEFRTHDPATVLIEWLHVPAAVAVEIARLIGEAYSTGGWRS